jgi:hypothetical protein
MKIMKLLALASLLLAASSALAVPFVEGTPFFAISLTGPGTGRVMEFALAGGAQQETLFNTYSYDGALDGTFNLAFQSAAAGPCEDGCVFTGTFTRWDPPFKIDSYCYLASGALNGTLTIGAVEHTVTAEYSQPMCQDEWFWSSTGGLAVHWRE